MAHALFGYDGACKNIHGHSYKLSVTIKGQPIVDSKNPKMGMVMDFTELKSIVKPIIEELDHGTMINSNTPHKKLVEKNMLFEKLVLVNYQPTCENILIDMAEYIQLRLPENIQLHHLKLQETPSSFAEWFAEDNK